MIKKIIFIFFCSNAYCLYVAFDHQAQRPIGNPSPCSYQWFDAVKSRSIGELKNMLLKGTVRINQVNVLGNNTLHSVADIRDTEISKAADYYWIAYFLINNGIDLNAKNFKGETPLLVAMKAKNQTVAKLIIKLGSRVYIYFGKHELKNNNLLNLYIKDNAGFSLLHNIVIEDNTELIEQIIEHTVKCDVNTVDNNGQTPLHFARSKQMVQLLIKMGADQEKEDRWGNKAIALAHENIVKADQAAGQEQKDQGAAAAAAVNLKSPRSPRKQFHVKTIPDIFRPSNFKYLD